MLCDTMTESNAVDVVMSYIGALDRQDYEAARKLMADRLPIKGPGETYDDPDRLIEILRTYKSKYDVKKVLSDGSDVSVLYELVTPSVKVFMCSWYEVRDGKIASIHTIFDPRPFGPPPGSKA